MIFTQPNPTEPTTELNKKNANPHNLNQHRLDRPPDKMEALLEYMEVEKKLADMDCCNSKWKQRTTPVVKEEFRHKKMPRMKRKW